MPRKRIVAVLIAAGIGLSGQAVRTQNQYISPSIKATDPQVRTTLNAMGEALGMLRGNTATDVIAQQEIWATGMAGTSILKTYHIGVNYNVPGMRVDMTTAKGRTIQVVSGKYAWNESQPGAGLDGEGTATPAMDSLNERQLQLWMLPHGVWKAANAAGDQAKVTTQQGVKSITFPAAGTTIKATLNAKNEIVKVEARMDDPAKAVVMTYSLYGDWNDANLPLARRAFSDVKLPRHIVETRGGKVVLTLNLTRTDTNNPYVVMPVPNNVEKAASTQ